MRFPLLLPRNPSSSEPDRPRHHVGAHRRPRRAPRLPDRSTAQHLGAAGVLALVVLVGSGGCGPGDNAGSTPSGSPVAVATSPSDSPSDSPTPTPAARPTTAAPAAVPTTRAAAPPRAADPTTPAAQQQQPQQQNTGCGGDYYVNSSGNCVHRPVTAPAPPAGATAKCNDGTYSFSQHRSGTCSGHRGVAEWL